MLLDALRIAGTWLVGVGGMLVLVVALAWIVNFVFKHDLIKKVAEGAYLAVMIPALLLVVSAGMYVLGSEILRLIMQVFP